MTEGRNQYSDPQQPGTLLIHSRYLKTDRGTQLVKPGCQCRRGGGSRYKLLGPGGPERGPGPDHVLHVFVFLGSIIIYRLYKLTLSDQTQVTLHLSVSLSDLVIWCKDLQPARHCSGDAIFFSFLFFSFFLSFFFFPGPKPALGGPDCRNEKERDNEKGEVEGNK